MVEFDDADTLKQKRKEEREELKIKIAEMEKRLVEQDHEIATLKEKLAKAEGENKER